MNPRLLKEELRQRFKMRCGYCGIHEALFLDGARSFSIDHFRPRHLYPELAEDTTNLVYACNSCNMTKGAMDSDRLINPSSDKMSEHFKFERSGNVVGITDKGEFTVAVLQLNRDSAVAFRRRVMTLMDSLDKRFSENVSKPIAELADVELREFYETVRTLSEWWGVIAATGDVLTASPGLELVTVSDLDEHLTPFLIEHLKRSPDDLIRITPRALEELIGEFFASWGFDDVKLVGRSGATAADVFAVEKRDPLGVLIHYFVEVKRWKDKVGVEVVDRVYGAMHNERSRWGWDKAVIVSLQGAKKMRKYSKDDLKLMGIEIRDKSNVVDWLNEYRPGPSGLWLPELRISENPPKR